MGAGSSKSPAEEGWDEVAREWAKLKRQGLKVWSRIEKEGAELRKKGEAMMKEPVFEHAVALGAGGSLLTLFAGAAVYRGVFRRYSTVEEIPKRFFGSRRVLKGRVTAVGDGDNFRMYHQPLAGRLLPVPSRPSKLKGKTLSIRLAGVDAPECAHFGQPGQPYGEEAKLWLRAWLVGKRVTLRVHSKDQYGRAVGSAWVRNWWGGWKNVSLELTRAGYATLYSGGGAEYGGIKSAIEKAEKEARKKKRGMWKKGKSGWVSPMAFKAASRGK